MYLHIIVRPFSAETKYLFKMMLYVWFGLRLSFAIIVCSHFKLQVCYSDELLELSEDLTKVFNADLAAVCLNGQFTEFVFFIVPTVRITERPNYVIK